MYVCVLASVHVCVCGAVCLCVWCSMFVCVVQYVCVFLTDFYAHVHFINLSKPKISTHFINFVGELL